MLKGDYGEGHYPKDIVWKLRNTNAGSAYFTFVGNDFRTKSSWDNATPEIDIRRSWIRIHCCGSPLSITSHPMFQGDHRAAS